MTKNLDYLKAARKSGHNLFLREECSIIRGMERLTKGMSTSEYNRFWQAMVAMENAVVSKCARKCAEIDQATTAKEVEANVWRLGEP